MELGGDLGRNVGLLGPLLGGILGNVLRCVLQFTGFDIHMYIHMGSMGLWRGIR